MTKLTTKEIEALFALHGVKLQDETKRGQRIRQFDHDREEMADGRVWAWWYTGEKLPAEFKSAIDVTSPDMPPFTPYDEQVAELWEWYNRTKQWEKRYV